MRVDEGDYFLCWRSSSAPKKLAARFSISLARFSSRNFLFEILDPLRLCGRHPRRVAVVTLATGLDWQSSDRRAGMRFSPRVAYELRRDTWDSMRPPTGGGHTSRAVFGNLHSTGVKAAADQDTLDSS